MAAPVVNAIPDPPTDYSGFHRWWAAHLGPRVSWFEANLWTQVSKSGAVAGDVGAPSLAAFNAHVNDTTDVHGATGTTLGTGNQASAGTRGPVFRAAAVSDVAVTSASVTEPDADVTYGTEERDLINELKADLNIALTALAALQTAFNAKLAADRAAEQQAT